MIINLARSMAVGDSAFLEAHLRRMPG